MSERDRRDVEHVDPLRDAYQRRIVEREGRGDSARAGRTALLCVDMQYLDAARGHGVFAPDSEDPIPEEAKDYYFDRLESVVFPNVRKLQDCFRRHGLEVIHIRIRALTPDGRDRSPGHKRLGLLAAPGSKEAEFIESVAPHEGEIVIDKTCSGVFSATNLGYVLRNLDIDSLVVTGVYTNECVSTTVREASDLGFLVTLAEDCCATVTPDLHRSAIATLRDRYARIENAASIVQELDDWRADGADDDSTMTKS